MAGIESKNPKSDTAGASDAETVSSSALERPFVKEFADLPEAEEIPSIEHDFTRAKAYLLRQCTSTGDNLWDHLSELLKKILNERPKGIADTLEEYSLKIRESRFRDKSDHLRDLFVPPEHYDLSQKLLKLLQPGIGVVIPDKNDEDEDEPKVRPDLMELLYFFEQAGVGLPRPEMFCIALHMKRLVASQPIDKCRFWGKILGLQKNYYIVETELKEDEVAKINMERDEFEEKLRLEVEEEESAKKEAESERRAQELEEARQREIDFAAERTEAQYAALLRADDERGKHTSSEPPKPSKPWPVMPPIPKSLFKPPPECPSEPIGIGSNKKVYFVCNDPGDEWVQLPEATPQQVVIARQIRRSMTGNLDSPVLTYPTFPGTEKNYLRAQIARISAATQISPLGFYTFNEEEEPEAEEEGGGKTNYMENPDYEPVAVGDLTDSSMSFWVHHTPYILKQGRTTWWNPRAKGEGNAEEEEGEDAEEEEGAEKEMGPELLTPLSEDAALDSTAPWSARSTSALFPEFAVAVVRSNLWPGAYAFATNKKFDNVYIGYGHKFSSYNHSPVPIPEVQEEYPLGPEILEIADPTIEEEEEWRLAHEKKLPSEGEEEEEDEGDEEEDE